MTFSKKIINSLIFCIGFTYCSYSFAADNTSQLNTIVAVVNNQVITEHQLNQEVGTITQQLQANHVALPPETVLQQRVLQEIIDRRLQLEMAQKSGIRVSTEEISQTIKNMVGPNKDAFNQHLEQSGMNIKEFRNEIKNELIIHKLQQRDVAAHVNVTPQEVDSMIRTDAKSFDSKIQYHVKDILVALPEAPSPSQIQKAKSQAKQIIAELNQGKDFSTTAVAQSGGQEALTGGDLGWRTLAELPTVFADKIKQMKNDTIDGPIRTPNGFHIIKLIGQRTPDSQEQVHIEQIVIKPSDLTNTTQIKDTLAKARQALEDGQDFASLAKKYSDDKTTANKGGDAGWITLDKSDFSNAISDLKDGQVSKPFFFGDAWYLVKVTAHRTVNSDAARKNQIQTAIFQRKVEENLQSWIAQLRAAAYIKVMLPNNNDSKAVHN